MDTNEIVLLGLSWEDWFSIAGTLTMLGWVILILGPRRWPWLNAVPAIGLPLILSIGYILLITTQLGKGEGGGFDSLAGVAALFTVPGLLLAGWVHYLAFDMVVGAWIARRSDEIGISRWIQAPVLGATFMLGPVGFFAFWVLRSLPAYRKDRR